MKPGRWDPARLHALLGVVPLGAFLVHHAWTLARMPAAGSATPDGSTAGALQLAAEVLLVLVPLAGHVALGVHLALTRPVGADAAPGAFRSALEHRWQRATGLVAAAFVVVHVAHGWAAKAGGAAPWTVVDRLAVDLGRPVYLTAYAIGLTAVAVHVGVGLPAALVRLGWARHPATQRAGRAAAVGLAVLLWGVSLEATARFAAGGGLFGAAGAPPG